MFLDISKAFDKIQHHTIEAALRRFGLPEVFIDLPPVAKAAPSLLNVPQWTFS